MGGQHSFQAVSDTLNSSSSLVENMTQNCISYVDASNTLLIQGTGNVVNNVTQEVTASVDSSCISTNVTAQSLSDAVNDSVAQTMKNQSVALTGMLDDSSQTSLNELTVNANTLTSVSSVQNCINGYNSSNFMLIAGTGNVVKNAIQKNQLTAINKCLSGTQTTSQSAVASTNTTNQYSQDISSNPFSFITDAIKSIMGEGILAIAFIFILVVCCIFVFAAFIFYFNRKPQLEKDEESGLYKPPATTEQKQSA
jgi:hypothetical protein